MAPETSKQELRAQMLGKLLPLSRIKISQDSFKVYELIVQSEAYQKALSVALYAPFQEEIETENLFKEAKKRGKKIAYPRISPQGHLDFFWVGCLSELKKSRWGMTEPDVSQEKVEFDQIEWMLIPGLAFDFKGWRLGRGKGFYDRTLSEFKGVRVGVGYSFQMINEVPHCKGDERVEWLVNEDEIFRCV